MRLVEVPSAVGLSGSSVDLAIILTTTGPMVYGIALCAKSDHDAVKKLGFAGW